MNNGRKYRRAVNHSSGILAFSPFTFETFIYTRSNYILFEALIELLARHYDGSLSICVCGYNIISDNTISSYIALSTFFHKAEAVRSK